HSLSAVLSPPPPLSPSAPRYPQTHHHASASTTHPAHAQPVRAPAGHPLIPYTTPFRSPATIRGTIYGANNAPVAGASVNAASAGGCPPYGSSGVTVADGTGASALTGLISGTYTVSASAPGYPQTYHNASGRTTNPPHAP